VGVEARGVAVRAAAAVVAVKARQKAVVRVKRKVAVRVKQKAAVRVRQKTVVRVRQTAAVWVRQKAAVRVKRKVARTEKTSQTVAMEMWRAMGSWTEVVTATWRVGASRATLRAVVRVR